MKMGNLTKRLIVFFDVFLAKKYWVVNNLNFKVLNMYYKAMSLVSCRKAVHVNKVGFGA
jgi:hypothetical protein